jgi:hypothetical protein
MIDVGLNRLYGFILKEKHYVSEIYTYEDHIIVHLAPIEKSYICYMGNKVERMQPIETVVIRSKDWYQNKYNKMVENYDRCRIKENI